MTNDLAQHGAAGTDSAYTPRKTPEIDPRQVRIQTEGFCYSEYQVRLPRSATMQDLNDPALWKLVQLGRTPLRRLDKLIIIDFDETFLVECFVAAATQLGASLSKPIKTDLPARNQQLMEDDRYRETWMGSGYAIVRKSDGHVMTEPTLSRQLAERQFRALYPEIPVRII